MKRKSNVCLWSFFLVIQAATGIFSVHADEVKPKYGPKGNPRAVSLAVSNDYFRSPRHRAPDFWALAGYYIPQFNGAACSVASVTMVLNAARAFLPKTSEDQWVTQTELLDRVNLENWKKRVSSEGFQGEHGMTLDRLGRVTEAAFKVYGLKDVSVRVVHVADRSALVRKELIRVLRHNEKSANDFVIANFNQREFTDDADVGHIAPVGAFDEQRQRVLILDPDRQYYEPYWVSLDTFLSGMATLDSASGLNRGYLVVSFKAGA